MSDNSLEQQSGQAQDTIVQISTSLQSSSESDQVSKERREGEEWLKLCQAALNGNWNAAKPIFKKLPVSTVISQRKETALHIAAAANHTHFAKQLVAMMSEEELALTNIKNNTAFFFVAISGNVELAKAMMKKNSELVTIGCGAEHKVLPLHMAALYGHREMVLYLYKATRDKLDGKLQKDDGLQVFIALLKSNLYDVALKLLCDQPDDYQDFFTRVLKDQIQMVLDLLARKPPMYSCIADESEQGIWKRCIKIFSGNNVVQNKTYVHQERIVKRLWGEAIRLENMKNQGCFKQLVFLAAKQGNVKLLTRLIHSYPELIWEKDDNDRSIFHIAVLQRHEEIFKLIHKIGSIKYLIATYKDKERNNMLHMAGKLAPLDRLKIVPGAALQLQRELLWFEEVKKIMQPQEVEAENMQPQEAKAENKQPQEAKAENKQPQEAKAEAEAENMQPQEAEAENMQSQEAEAEAEAENMQSQEAEAQNRECQTPGETPGALFTKEHSNLMKEGEKWMRETANSCMIVATLIATVVFAAAFTVPGGNKDQTGIPIFLESISFKIFAVSDAISLLFSCISILVFLSILTSRYTERDFLWSLPNKLIIGLVTLLISIAAMMAAFSATFYIVFNNVFNHGLHWLVIVVAVIAIVPVILFVWLHRRLFLDVILSTYRSRSMFHPS